MIGTLAAQTLSLGSLTVLDVLLLLVVLYSCVRGFFQGFISELGLLVALVAGTLLASRFAAEVGAPLERLAIVPRARAAFGYIIIFAAVWVVTRIITGLLRGGSRLLLLGPLDHLIGAVFGLLRGLLVVVVAGFVIVHFRLAPLSTVAHDSPIIQAVSPLYPTLNGLLPAHLQVGPTTP